MSNQLFLVTKHSYWMQNHAIKYNYTNKWLTYDYSIWDQKFILREPQSHDLRIV